MIEAIFAGLLIWTVTMALYWYYTRRDRLAREKVRNEKR